MPVWGSMMCVVAGLGMTPGVAAPPVRSAAPVQSASSSLLWRDLSRVNVLCLVRSDGADRLAFEARLCARARAAAARGAPVPVHTVPLGDRALLAADAATLLVHASVQPGARGDRLLALSVRPFRNSSEQTTELFGAAPRAVTLSDAAALDRALGEAVAELLPWQAISPGPRPIP